MQINNSAILNRCPLCASSSIYQVGKLKYREKINFSSHEVVFSHIPELWKCQGCLSCFVQNTVDVETAKMLYSTGQPGDRWSKVPFDQSKTYEVIEHMSAIFKNKGNVLDVGCNTGELLDFALKFGCKTSGVEFSLASREILSEKGHRPYATLEDSPGGYDVITAFDLVEHLHDVPAFLKICREKLSAKGRLVILTGNVNSFSARRAGSNWWYAQYPEHIVFPSKRYFRGKTSFRIEKWIGTYASVGYRFPVKRIWSEILNSVLRRQTYTGLPSIGPDHVLIFLKK